MARIAAYGAIRVLTRFRLDHRVVWLARAVGPHSAPAPTYAFGVATRPTSKPEEQADAVADDLHRYIDPVVGPDDERRFTDSGIEVDRLYDADDVAPGLEKRLGEPGSYPYTRGIHPGMYRDRLWTMRQYAGFASPEDTNERYRYLIDHGSTGLSMAFDLPTQLGRDSDDPLCEGEVGRTGVPIDTIEDMRICFDQIPLDEISTSMTINAPAAILLLLYELVGEEQDVAPEKLRGTVQNDVLKEYVARGNYIYPPEATMRLTTDIFEYCRKHVPKWNTISISGYHIREKGCSAVQEVAFTMANAIAYVGAALDRGLAIDDFGPRLAFFFNCHNNVFQEIAKFRAARRMWSKIMRERFGSTDERSQTIRFHTQTGGVTLQAQQPEVNIIRVALQGFAAVAGGTQSLHTNGFDEALALPTERSARIALRTQQVIAYESGAADTVDPFAGSYFIESLTDEIEKRAWELIDKVEQLGGSVQALEFIQREIEESAASYHERYRSGQDIVVGVNKFVTDEIDDVEILRVDPESERRQLERLARFKEARDAAAVEARLDDLRKVAADDGNLLYPIKDALRDRASIGEVCGAMREVFGEYRGGAFF
jgi:methylmalonyl-CoA mutase N-terminal domain/subunit